MPESNGSEMPEFFSAVKIYEIPCAIEDSLAPSEVQATVILGSKTLYILAPITKVDPEKRDYTDVRSGTNRRLLPCQFSWRSGEWHVHDACQQILSGLPVADTLGAG